MATIMEKKVARPKIKETQCFIGGKWVPSASGKTFETIHPATEEVICEVAEGDAEDVDLAVDAAREAFDNGPWSKMDARDRGALMYKLADLIEEDAENLAAIETLDNGKPISDSRAADIPLVIDCLRYYAGWADKIQGRTIPIRGELLLLHAARAGRRRRSDHSLELPGADGGLEVGPGAGGRLHDRDEAGRANAALVFADGEARAEAGIPDGVINVVPGYGPTAGAAIVKHPGVDKIAFTGEGTTAKIIQREAAETMKRLTFELGGKSPNVIFADADLEAAVEGAHFALYFNQGQCCCAGSRLFVEEKVHDEVVDRLPRRTRARKVGDPFDPETQAGSAGRSGPVRQDPAVRRVRQEGRRELRHRRQAHRRQGLLCRADAVRERDRRHANRPGRDLRPRAERAEVQERERDDSAGRTTRISAWRRRFGRATSPRPIASPRACGPARCGSIATTCSTPRPRSAASSKAASAASWAKPASRNYTELKTVTVSMT